MSNYLTIESIILSDIVFLWEGKTPIPQNNLQGRLFTPIGSRPFLHIGETLSNFTFIVVSIIGFAIIFILGEILPDKPQKRSSIRVKRTSESL